MIFYRKINNTKPASKNDDIWWRCNIYTSNILEKVSTRNSIDNIEKS